MKRLVFAVALLLMAVPAVLAAGCGDQKVPAGAIAAVGSNVVTQEQFDTIWAQAKAQYASQQGAPAFPKDGTAQFKQLRASIVAYLVQNAIIAQKASGEGVKVTDKEYQDRLKQILTQVGGQKKLDALLKKQGVDMNQLEIQLKAQMLQDKMQQKVAKAVKISDAQAQAYYNDAKNKAQFDQPETVDARHVLVKTKAQAVKVRALLAADNTDANWKKVAAKYSTDPGSKNNGGSLGTFPKGRMVPPFEKAAFALKVNEISQPVKTQFGWHVIEVLKKTAAKHETFAEAKTQIQQMLLYSEQSKVWQKWLDQAKKDADVKYAAGFNPQTLTATPSPSGSPAQ